MKENLAILDRSIPRREASVHSIPVREVKDMKSNVLRASKPFNYEKTSNLVCGLKFNITQEKNCIDFEFLSITFPPF
jgi:hypothetical protein